MIFLFIKEHCRIPRPGWPSSWLITFAKQYVLPEVWISRFHMSEVAPLKISFEWLCLFKSHQMLFTDLSGYPKFVLLVRCEQTIYRIRNMTFFFLIWERERERDTIHPVSPQNAYNGQGWAWGWSQELGNLGSPTRMSGIQLLELSLLPPWAFCVKKLELGTRMELTPGTLR